MKHYTNKLIDFKQLYMKWLIHWKTFILKKNLAMSNINPDVLNFLSPFQGEAVKVKEELGMNLSWGMFQDFFPKIFVYLKERKSNFFRSNPTSLYYNIPYSILSNHSLPH